MSGVVELEMMKNGELRMMENKKRTIFFYINMMWSLITKHFSFELYDVLKQQ